MDELPYPLVVHAGETSVGKAVAVVTTRADLLEAILAALDLYPDVTVTVERMRYERA